MNINQKILLLNINNKYKEIKTKSVYEMTNGNWCVDLNNVEGIKFVCAVVKGEIIEIFEITNWTVCENDPKRKTFDGELASNDIRVKLIGKSVKEYWKKGSQNPVKYAELNDIFK